MVDRLRYYQSEGGAGPVPVGRVSLRRVIAGGLHPFRLATTFLLEEAMLQEHSMVHTVGRKYVWLSTVAVVVSALLLVVHATWADDQQDSGRGKREPAVRLLKTIPIPGTD